MAQRFDELIASLFASFGEVFPVIPPGMPPTGDVLIRCNSDRGAQPRHGFAVVPTVSSDRSAWHSRSPTCVATIVRTTPAKPMVG